MESIKKPSTSSALADIEHSLDYFLSELDRYSEADFSLNPDEESWSIGQVYSHLHDASVKYFYKTIQHCLNSTEFQDENMNENGKSMFQNGVMPKPKIKVMDRSEYDPHQPASIEEAKTLIAEMREGAKASAKLLDAGTTSGKVKHPFYDYLDAWQWFQFAAIHFRHHFMQKGRIDAFLEEKKAI